MWFLKDSEKLRNDLWFSDFHIRDREQNKNWFPVENSLQYMALSIGQDPFTCTQHNFPKRNFSAFSHRSRCLNSDHSSALRIRILSLTTGKFPKMLIADFCEAALNYSWMSSPKAGNMAISTASCEDGYFPLDSPQSIHLYIPFISLSYTRQSNGLLWKMWESKIKQNQDSIGT